MSNSAHDQTASRLQPALDGRYRIERELGAGGMATVYLAEDLKHHRKVAIKVLHAELSAILGPERFLKEIELTASLQHPHILPLFDSGSADGLLFYVMPYVDGETLRGRLDREKQLPIADAVRIASEAADALAYAHGRGIVHRDIKPENILLQNGHALVADFGIALAVQQAGGQRMTQTGLSLGTPQYMSPEQAMGERDIGPCSDIYSLGAVTYEMLSGDPPFIGSSAQAIVAQVITSEPRSLVAQRKSVPEYVDAAVMTALEKLPADRFANASQFAEALDGKSAAHATRGRSAARGGRDRRISPATSALVAALVLASALAVWGWLRSQDASPQLATSLAVTVPADVTLSSTAGEISISEDGRRVVFTGQSAGGRMLYVRDLGAAAVHALSNTEGADSPFFSPDGQTIAFAAHGALWTVSASGGVPEQIAGTNDGSVDLNAGIAGGDWGQDGIIRYTPRYRFQGILAVPAEGGAPKVIVSPDSTAGIGIISEPQQLPGGKLILCAVTRTGSGGLRMGVVSLTTGHVRFLDVGAIVAARYAHGYVVYVAADGAAFAAPFNASRGELTGPAVRLPGLDGVAPALALSRDGTLVYLAGAKPTSHMVMVSRVGHATVLDRDPQDYNAPTLSPDGSRIAVEITGTDGRGVWLFDMSRHDMTRFTIGGDADYPLWSRDGRRIAYSRLIRGTYRILASNVDGTGAADTLVSGVPYHFPGGWTRGDSSLVYRQNNVKTNEDIYIVHLADHAIRAIANTPFTEIQPVVSPDDRWVAFASNETGRREVYVQRLDGTGGKTPVSMNGGDEPRWGADGQQLYYRGTDSLYAVSFRGPAAASIGKPVALFPDHFLRDSRFQDYDVLKGGAGFVMLQPVQAAPAELRVVLDWPALMTGHSIQ